MSVTVYCSLIDVQNRLSAAGVTYRLDDTPPASDGDVLDQASSLVDSYLIQQYDNVNVNWSLNRWVKHTTADVAAALLCERRGNAIPLGIARKFERAIGWLEQVELGRKRVPGLAQRRIDAPTLALPRIRLDPFPRTVIERMRGVVRNPPTDYDRRDDSLEWFDYSI